MLRKGSWWKVSAVISVTIDEVLLTTWENIAALNKCSVMASFGVWRFVFVHNSSQQANTHGKNNVQDFYQKPSISGADFTLLLWNMQSFFSCSLNLKPQTLLLLTSIITVFIVNNAFYYTVWFFKKVEKVRDR